jgi:uncharacterized membrane protein
MFLVILPQTASSLTRAAMAMAVRDDNDASAERILAATSVTPTRPDARTARRSGGAIGGIQRARTSCVLWANGGGPDGARSRCLYGRCGV